jgi:hypothetical protein
VILLATTRRRKRRKGREEERARKEREKKNASLSKPERHCGVWVSSSGKEKRNSSNFLFVSPFDSSPPPSFQFYAL